MNYFLPNIFSVSNAMRQNYKCFKQGRKTSIFFIESIFRVICFAIFLVYFFKHFLYYSSENLLLRTDLSSGPYYPLINPFLMLGSRLWLKTVNTSSYFVMYSVTYLNYLLFLNYSQFSNSSIPQFLAVIAEITHLIIPMIFCTMKYAVT